MLNLNVNLTLKLILKNDAIQSCLWHLFFIFNHSNHSKHFSSSQHDDIEKWQLVKRFFLIDSVTGRININASAVVDDDEMKFYEQFSQISYVKSIEVRFQLSSSADNDADDDENSDEINKIGIPLVVIEYGTLNLTQIASIIKSSSYADEDNFYNVDFTFKIKFTKRPNLNFFFQIILPIFILIAFFYSLMCTFFYKISQQKIEYDLAILVNFIINLFANVSNAFFMFVLIFIGYVFFVYKTQSSVIKIMLPLEREESMIEILLVFAIIFKVGYRICYYYYCYYKSCAYTHFVVFCAVERQINLLRFLTIFMTSPNTIYAINFCR